jgi:FAD/FMN-containing dehydrogenase
MGGHSLVEGGVVLDMGCVAHVSYDAAAGLATAGAGATWADLIRTLNAHGKTPRTLQSYASFSIGGTLAVNGHGITSDHCVAESVVALTIVRGDGAVVRAARGGPHEQLLRHALGGYGLFGVIYEATLRVDDNVRLAQDVLSVPAGDAPHIYAALLAAYIAALFRLAAKGRLVEATPANTPLPQTA